MSIIIIGLTLLLIISIVGYTVEKKIGVDQKINELTVNITNTKGFEYYEDYKQ